MHAVLQTVLVTPNLGSASPCFKCLPASLKGSAHLQAQRLLFLLHEAPYKVLLTNSRVVQLTTTPRSIT